MSSAKHHGVIIASDLSSAQANEVEAEQDWLYAELADGLHAMAQPLTILRSAIAMLSASAEGDASRSRFLDLSVRQIDRTCGLFASVQDLVSLGLEAVQQIPVDLGTLLSQAVEEQRSAYQNAGVALVAAIADAPPQIFGDPQRTEKAIAVLLATALSSASQGDTVEIAAKPSGGLIEVRIAGAQAGRSLNSSERLNLAVARANILTQRGSYQFQEEPFFVTLNLPVCPADSQTGRHLLVTATTS